MGEKDHDKKAEEASERAAWIRGVEEHLRKINTQARENERLARERREQEGK